VGAGGIGSSLVELLCPAISASRFSIDLTLLDSDLISEENLAFQRFSQGEIGMAKVSALAIRHSSRGAGVAVNALVEDLCQKEQISGHDLIIIAVDRPEPRRLVHRCEADWFDLRCMADGWLMLDHTTPGAIIDMLTPNHPPASCQHPGALADSNIRYGYAVAAAHGAEWVMQWLRERSGLDSQRPLPSMGRISTGSLPFPVMREVEAN